jgi:glycine transporter
MDVPHGFDPTFILALNLAGTFVFGLSGGLAAVRARLDLFGVVVLAAVVGLAGGITRDLLIGTPPATFRDWRYLAAAGAAGLVSFFAGPTLERLRRQRPGRAQRAPQRLDRVSGSASLNRARRRRRAGGALRRRA